METFLFFVALAIVIFICWKVHSSYERKVDEVKNYFLNKISQYTSLKDLNIEVRTDGKKVKTWDSQHIVDYIIICNKDQVINALKLYNNFVMWWDKNSNSLLKETRQHANYIANSMIIWGGTFRKRTADEISRLENSFNPDNIYFNLRTYTVHSSTRHYNPNTHEWWNDASPIQSTYYNRFKPNDVLARIEVLAQYNFEMTEHQYNCDNQRKLMTQELREQIIERDQSICQICHKKCRRDEIEIDHIKPVSKGGKTTISNLQVLCSTCNRQKSNKWLEDMSGIYQSISNKPKVTENYEKKWDDFNKKYNETKYNNLLPKEKCVEVGDTVLIRYVEDGDELELKLVENNGNSKSNYVTLNSPIGQAILGQTVGDTINARTPNGITTIEIVRLTKNK